MSNRVWIVVTYAIIFILISIAPTVVIYRGMPWFVIIASFLPLLLFSLMRIVGFMNEIESGLVCVILSFLIALLFPAIQIKMRSGKVANGVSIFLHKVYTKWPNKAVQTEPVTCSFQARSGQEFAAGGLKGCFTASIPPLSS